MTYTIVATNAGPSDVIVAAPVTDTFDAALGHRLVLDLLSGTAGTSCTA